MKERPAKSESPGYEIIYVSAMGLELVTTTATGVATTATGMATTAATTARALWAVSLGLVCVCNSWVQDIHFVVDSGKYFSCTGFSGTGVPHYNEEVDEQCQNQRKKQIADILHRLGNSAAFQYGVNLFKS